MGANGTSARNQLIEFQPHPTKPSRANHHAQSSSQKHTSERPQRYMKISYHSARVGEFLKKKVTSYPKACFDNSNCVLSKTEVLIYDTHYFLCPMTTLRQGYDLHIKIPLQRDCNIARGGFLAAPRPHSYSYLRFWISHRFCRAAIWVVRFFPMCCDDDDIGCCVRAFTCDD